MRISAFPNLATIIHAAEDGKACIPGRNEVTVFQHSYFNGICSVLPIVEYGNSKAMRIKNDSIYSTRVGLNVQVEVCQHSNYKGRCERFSALNARRKNNNIDNDSITSMKITRKRR